MQQLVQTAEGCTGIRFRALTSCACLQIRRAGAVAVTKAVADKQQLQLLDLDANEIPETAVDTIKASEAVGPFCDAWSSITLKAM